MKKISKFITQPELAEQMATVGHEYIKKHFSWKAIADNFEEIIERYGRDATT